MKRLLVLAAVVLGGCSAPKPNTAPVAPAIAAAPQPVRAGGSTIERVPFRLGVSSATVEKMGRQQGCRGGPGAGLVTEAGPVEVYRMQCNSAQVFLARCELRQCRKM